MNSASRNLDYRIADKIVNKLPIMDNFMIEYYRSELIMLIRFKQSEDIITIILFYVFICGVHGGVTKNVTASVLCRRYARICTWAIVNWNQLSKSIIWIIICKYTMCNLIPNPNMAADET